MSFHSLMMHLVAELRSTWRWSPTVVELGNHRFNPHEGDVALMRKILIDRGQPFDDGLLQEIGVRAGAELSASTADYYRALGFKSYRSIECFAAAPGGRSSPAFFDDTFDLVTNNGSGEHVFDQSRVFATAHALCNVGGIMLHVLPFFNYLNHGFYNYNPILFEALATANCYELCRLSIASTRGGEIGDHPIHAGAPTLSQAELLESCVVDGSSSGSLAHLTGIGKARKRGRRPLSLALRRVMSIAPNVCIVAALRKVVDRPFRAPVQGASLPDSEGWAATQSYARANGSAAE